MARNKDVELSTEELLDEVNNGSNNLSLAGQTVRVQIDETVEEAAQRAMEEIREANSEAAQARTFGDPRYANAAATDPRLVAVAEGRLDPRPTADIRATLEQRAKSHGEYSEHAATTQMLKRIMRAAPKWDELSYHEQETLEMVAHKIGRILCGDPHAHDHWHDIAGYATLSADRNK